jgi:hypothetical protein
MTNEFGDKLRQHVDDCGRVEIRPKQREFNVKRVVRRVNTNMDEFITDNTNMHNVDFEDVSVGHGECYGQ